jgi:magnesium chelatase accessory protein
MFPHPGTDPSQWQRVAPQGRPASGTRCFHVMVDAVRSSAPGGSAMKRAQALDWATDGADWPNRHSSRFIKTADLTWHVQTMGQGPVLLLAHGTGASTHSWRDLMPSLARHFTVVAPDLQGHGFTGTPRTPGITVQVMASGLEALLQVLGVSPAVAVGHSAGAAILARLARSDGIAPPAVLVALNGAMLPIPGVVGSVMRGAARMLASSPAIQWMVSRRTRRPRIVEKMIANTGSTLNAAGIDYYARLMGSPVHVHNVLRMLAHWDLRQIVLDLPRLPCRLVLVAADGDRALPPKVARQTAALVPGCELIIHRSYGHLSHEEAPEETAAFIVQAARDSGIALDRDSQARPAATAVGRSPEQRLDAAA